MKLKIEIDNEKSIVKEIDDSGVEKTKEVLTGDLLSALSENEVQFESPILPGPYGVRKFVKKGNSTYYLFLEQPREIELQYSVYDYEDNYHELYDSMDDVYGILNDYDITVENNETGQEVMKVPTVLPNTVWMVKVTESSTGVYYEDMKVFAMDGPAISGHEELSRFPFSNIYEDGRICWGSVTLSSPSVQAIQGLSTRFLGTLFNLDLYYNVEYIETDYGTYNDTMVVHSKISKNYSTPEERLNALSEYFLTYRGRDGDVATLDNEFESFVRQY